MWPFDKIHTEEYEALLKRVITCEQRITGLEYAEENLRNKVLRKIQKPREEEEIDEDDIPSGLLTARGVKVGPNQ